jgi:hypothetical protein
VFAQHAQNAASPAGLQGRAHGPAATAVAIPDVLFWGAPAAAVLVAPMALLPSPRG